MKHTPEPWSCEGNTVYKLNGKGFKGHPDGINIFTARFLSQDCKTEEVLANAHRTVTAVNACAGIPTAALEAGVVKDALAACEQAEDCIDPTAIGGQLALEMVRAVLAKVKGSQA